MLNRSTIPGFKSVLAVAMFAQASVFMLQRGPAVVTAFSLATTFSTKSAVAASRSASSYGVRHAFCPRTSAASMKLQMSSVLEEGVDLKEKVVVEHPAYEVIEKDFIEEYGAAATLYRHKKSGAELLSVSTDDDNKVFGVTFRTPPEDSTGVPHILEHSVLCGSRKYTTKDPFVQLLAGSLQTFLNAFTYPDRTCYVVASQNDKDFYNLISGK